jgi:hypothetical protein
MVRGGEQGIGDQKIGRYDAAIAAEEDSQGCERFLRASLATV